MNWFDLIPEIAEEQRAFELRGRIKRAIAAGAKAKDIVARVAATESDVARTAIWSRRQSKRSPAEEWLDADADVRSLALKLERKALRNMRLDLANIFK